MTDEPSHPPPPACVDADVPRRAWKGFESVLLTSVLLAVFAIVIFDGPIVQADSGAVIPVTVVTAAATPAPRAPRAVLVVCAPGYPGDTKEAQPTMDAFATAVESAAALPAGSLGAIYYETLDGGLDRLSKSDAALALVPYPFFVEYRTKLGLKPQLQVVDDAGSTEVWSLAAKRGRVTSAASLDGWELTGGAGYAPSFVKGPALGAWGGLPTSAHITFSPAVLGPLRKASQGESIAVLLDGAQAASFATLPFANQVEIVTKSKPLPKSLVCTVGEGRMTSEELKAVTRALLGLQRTAEGKTVLKTMRMARFEPASRSLAAETLKK